MTPIEAKPEWSEVPQIEVGDRVRGGKDGPVNKQAQALANRVEWLKEFANAFSDPSEARDIIAWSNGDIDSAKRMLADKVASDVVVSPEDFMRPGLTVTQAFQKFLEYASANPVRAVASGQYVLNGPLSIPTGVSIDLETTPGSLLDFRSADLTAADGAITFGSNADYTVLPSLGANVSRWGMSVVFSSAPDLVPGDIFIIEDVAPSSWGGWTNRSYYHKGDYLRVKSVSGNTVVLDRPIFDSYKTTDNIRIIKIHKNNVSLKLGGRILFDPSQTKSGIVVWNGYRSVVEVKNTSGFQRAHVDLRRCYDTIAPNLYIDDYGVPVSLNYGVSMIGCFNTWVVDGSIRTARHAVTLTGGGIDGSIPNRLCGTKNSTLIGDLFAADMHGSCDYCGFFGGYAVGGVQYAGSNSRTEGVAVWTVNSPDFPDSAGMGYRGRELINFNHSFEDSKIHVVSAAVGNNDATIVARYEQQLSVTNFENTGTIKLRNIDVYGHVYSPRHIRFVIPATVQGGVSFDIEDIRYHSIQTTESALLRIDVNAGGYVDDITIKGLKNQKTIINAAARRWNLDGAYSRNSSVAGHYITAQAAPVYQFVRIKDFSAEESAEGGIVVAGPAQDYAGGLEVEVIDSRGVNNNKANTTFTRFKAGLAFNNLPLAVARGCTLGDVGSGTQDFTLSMEACGVVYDLGNRKIGTGAIRRSNVTTLQTSLPPLS